MGTSISFPLKLNRALATAMADRSDALALPADFSGASA